MRWYFLSLVMLNACLFNVSEASEIDNTLVAEIVVQGANSTGVDRVCIYPATDTQSWPGCASFPRYCADVNTDIGKAYMSVALTAYASGRPVKLAGTGSCSLVTNSETLSYIILRN